MPDQFNHGYALLIGVGDCVYAPWSLPTTVKDMQALAAILADPTLCAYPENQDHIRLLHDDGATRAVILDGLDWLSQQAAADPEATAIVFYSGHGWLDENNDRYYLIPHDVQPFDLAGSALAAADFDDALSGIDAKRLLVFIDSCHAEGMATAKDQPAVTLPQGFSQTAIPKAIVDQLRQGEGRAVFTSSRGEQRSWVRPDNTLSLYTYHLIEALQGAGNQPGDTVVRLSNLMNHLDSTVPASARQLVQADQRPFFSMATEDFPVALLRGGKGLPSGGWDDRTPAPPLPPSITVTGDRNVVAGRDLRDNVIVTGDNASVQNARGNAIAQAAKGGHASATHIENVQAMTVESAIVQQPPDPGQVDPEELYRTYLSRVVAATSTLDLSGVDRRAVGDQEDARLELAAVYTALDTNRAVEKEISEKDDERLAKVRGDAISDQGRERQSALQFVAQEPFAALLGDPGSGKTTFANFLALCLAGERLGLKQANLTHLGKEWAAGPLLPLRVVLRSFAAQLADRGNDPANDLLWRHIIRGLGDSLSSFVPLLNVHLLEQGGLLILDGLDEVPEAQRRRQQVKQAILDIKSQYPRLRILLTSRTYAYQRQEWRLPDFEEAVLSPFNQGQIQAFVDRWYGHIAQIRSNLSSAEAEGRAMLLKHAIDRNGYLRELAPRPLLLTLMASLHAWRGGSLPEDREQLYDESVELLLDIWERPKVVVDPEGAPRLQTEGVAEWMQAPKERVRKALEKLAYQVHGRHTELEGAADIPEGDLVVALMHAAANPDLKQGRILEYVRDRAGLLTNRGEGVYSFPHRTFQEYMAARYLSNSGFPKTLVQRVREDPERWREVLLLAGAKVARGTQYAAWSLVSQLCGRQCEGTAAQSATDVDWTVSLLAGQLLVETGIHRNLDPTDDAANLETLAKVRSWLTTLIGDGHLPPTDRAAAGRALAVLGDERLGVGVEEGVPDIAWVEVAPGLFLMGSDKQQDKLAYSSEMPQFTCRFVRQPYRIGRYPITVGQYGAFVDAGGYDNAPYWREAASAGLWRDGKLKCFSYSLTTEEYVEGWVSSPHDYGVPYNLANHPQVGVSWYEALAFCRWLTDRTGMDVRLPSEAQWERAACHTDGRIYPWGNEFDKTRLNMIDTGIGSTSAVGIFPRGHAVCGAADMAGNVLEWCRTEWLDNYSDYERKVNDAPAGGDRRVVRGGAFYNDLVYVRCAGRNWDGQDYRGSWLGFRVMSPGL